MCTGIKCEVVETQRRDHATDILLDVAGCQLDSLDGVILVRPLLQPGIFLCGAALSEAVY